MAVNMFVRKSFNANAVKDGINAALGTKLKSIRTDTELNNELARAWAELVTPYVPRSKINDGHHLQDYYISDGRVIWRRPARSKSEALGLQKGQDLAYLLYMSPITGQYRSRYPGHQPIPYWDEMVRPGMPDWETFIEMATDIVNNWLSQ